MMSPKVPVTTQARTPAIPGPVPARQSPAAALEHTAERPNIATQLEDATRLGHRLGAISVSGSVPPIIQRQELPEEEEEEELQLEPEPTVLQRQELSKEKEEEMIKPDAHQVGPEGGPVHPGVEAAIRRARGGGQPLEDALQEQMSAALGHDFSGVRVHTGLEADELNQQLSAKAFTTGTDIFFRRGGYVPGSSGGRELIAHELTHVVQQSSGQVPVGGGGSGLTVRPAGDALESEADTLSLGTGISRHGTVTRRTDPDSHQNLPSMDGTIQRGGDSGRVIQLKRLKVTVTKPGGAGLHKARQEGERTRVRSGGLLRTGIGYTVPRGRNLIVDTANVIEEGTEFYIWAEHVKEEGETVEGYVNKANVRIVDDEQIRIAGTLLNPYLETHYPGQFIAEQGQEKGSMAQMMKGLLSVASEEEKAGHSQITPSALKARAPESKVGYWETMGRGKLEQWEKATTAGRLAPIRCNEATAVAVTRLRADERFTSSLTVVKQGDPAHGGHWYVLANLDPQHPAEYGRPLLPGEFIIDIWGALMLKHQGEGYDPGTVVFDNTDYIRLLSTPKEPYLSAVGTFAPPEKLDTPYSEMRDL